MPDFQFLKTPMGGYVILAPQREKRPDEAKGFTPICPFCIGNEDTEKEVFRIPTLLRQDSGGQSENWQVRVLPNKFPFAPIHEIIIHSPDHHKNFDELPLQQVQTVFEAFQERYNAQKEKGTVFLFSNNGELAGASLPHPHSQLVVIPHDIDFVVPKIQMPDGEVYGTEFFTLYAPITSQWPDEVWIVPKKSGKTFGQITQEERNDLSFNVQRLMQLFTVKHGHEFPFNFYIYPKENWYLRFIPREKKLGGIEISSNLFVNTGDPRETMRFIKEKF